MLFFLKFYIFSFPLGLLLSFIGGVSLEQTFVCLLVCKESLSLFQCCFCRDRPFFTSNSMALSETHLSTLVGLFLDHRSCSVGQRPGACQHCALPAVGLGNRRVGPLSCSLQNVLSILGLLLFHTKFRISPGRFAQKPICILLGLH